MTAIWFHTEILSGGLGGVIRTTGSLGGCASCIIKQLSGFFYMYMYNTLFDFAGTFNTTNYTSNKSFILKYFRCRDGKRTETRIGHGMEGICITVMEC